jgi:hypothetical protein
MRHGCDDFLAKFSRTRQSTLFEDPEQSSLAKPVLREQVLLIDPILEHSQQFAAMIPRPAGKR